MESSHQITQGMNCTAAAKDYLFAIVTKPDCNAMKYSSLADSQQTIELTRLQVGGGLGPVNIIVSTIIEAEHVVPLLLEYKAAGRAVSVSFPPQNSTLLTLSSSFTAFPLLPTQSSAFRSFPKV